MITVSPQLSLIPFANHDDGNRLHMAASQLRQALPLIYGEPPIVVTGYEPLVISLNRKSEWNGVVKFVNRRVIVIYDEEEKRHEIVRLSYADIPIVSTGDRVSKGSLIAIPQGYRTKTILDDNYYAYGINVYTGILNHPQGFEDAYVIDENLKNRFASYIPEVKQIILKRDEFLIHLDEENILPPLNKPIKGPILIISDTSLKKRVIELPFEVVIDYIQISVNKKLPLQEDIPPYFKGFLSRKLQEARELYTTLIKETDEETANKVYQLMSLEGTYAMDSKNWSCVITIYFKKLQTGLDYGDKITNRHAGKGVVSHYERNLPVSIPDNQKIQLLLNPMSVISRMNFGTFMELLASRIIYWFKKRIDGLLEEKNLDEAIIKINRFYNVVDKTPGKHFFKQVDRLVRHVYTNISKEDACKMLSKINWQFPATPFYSVSLDELKGLARNIIPSVSMKETTIKEMLYQYGEFSEKLFNRIVSYEPYGGIYININTTPSDHSFFIDPLLSVGKYEDKFVLVNSGFLYYMKLVHLSKLKLSARSIGEINIKNLQPKKVKKSFITQESEYDYGYETEELVELTDIMENYENEGEEYYVFGNTPQRVGEMETFCLISYDVLDYVKELLTQSEDIKSKLNLVLSLIFNIPYSVNMEKNTMIRDYLRVLGF